MSLLGQIAEMQRELRPLKTATCNVRRAPTFAAPGTDVLCHYERFTPAAGVPVDFETGNGYGYTVWFDEPVTPAPVNADTVTVDGITISVQRVPEAGNLTPGTRIEGVAR